MTPGCRRSAAAGPTAPALLAFLILASGLPAQEVRFGGQVRPRFEVRDPLAGGSEAFTTMRVRARLDADVADGVRAFVQLQDVRIWGEETSTLGDFSADALDLHQGWIELGDGDGGFQGARVGRQEVAFGGERLIGTVGWTPQGRAFDGARVTLGSDRLRLNLFGFQVADAFAGTTPADGELAGAYAAWRVADGRTLDLYGILDRVEAAQDSREGTLGARYAADGGPWRYRVEGSLQTGTRADADVSAWMAGARVGRYLADGKGWFTLWYDVLSGDDAAGDGETGVFNTLYATNHKFYGFADLFTDIPSHTGGLGLQDVAIKVGVRPGTGLDVALDLHAFRTAASRGDVDGRLAEEADLTLAWQRAPGVTVQGGVSYVRAGPGLADLGRLSENMVFGYVMLSASF